jgi:hypothetical protein
MRGHLPHRGGDAWRLKVYVGRCGGGRKRYAERTIRGTQRGTTVALVGTIASLLLTAASVPPSEPPPTSAA